MAPTAPRSDHPFAAALFQVIDHSHHRLAVPLQGEGDRGLRLPAVVLDGIHLDIHGVEVQVASRLESVHDRLAHGVGILDVTMTGREGKR